MRRACCYLLVSCLFYMEAGAQRKIKEMDPQKAAQDQAAKDYENGHSESWTDRLTYGGNIWLSFGSNFSQFFLQPLVGYRVTDNFMVGTGVTYIYWSQKFTFSNNQSFEFSDHVIGLNFFARHKVLGPVFAHTEYQPMNFKSFNQLGETRRVWTNALYLGGGLNQSFGSSGAYVLVLYDVLWRSYDPVDPKSFAGSFYPSPWDIRIGFLF